MPPKVTCVGNQAISPEVEKIMTKIKTTETSIFVKADISHFHIIS